MAATPLIYPRWGKDANVKIRQFVAVYSIDDYVLLGDWRLPIISLFRILPSECILGFIHDFDKRCFDVFAQSSAFVNADACPGNEFRDAFCRSV